MEIGVFMGQSVTLSLFLVKTKIKKGSQFLKSKLNIIYIYQFDIIDLV